MASRASKDITNAAVGNSLDNRAGEGVVQEHFRIPTGLAVRIADAAHERRCSRRALWVAAMEAYLSQATEPTGHEETDAAYRAGASYFKPAEKAGM